METVEYKYFFKSFSGINLKSPKIRQNIITEALSTLIKLYKIRYYLVGVPYHP